MVLDEEKDSDSPAFSHSAVYRVSGSGNKPQNRPKSIAIGKTFPSIAPRNSKTAPSLSSEDGETDSPSNSVNDESNASTPSIQLETGGHDNGFDALLDLEPNGAIGYRQSNDDKMNDVIFSEFTEHRNGGDNKEGDNGEEEDAYGHLAEQIQRSEEHVPLHKSVCCALCRKKEQRLRKRTQDRSILSCPDSSENPSKIEYGDEGTPIFARISQTDRNPMLSPRSPDSEAGGFHEDDDGDSSSYSSLFRSVESDDGFHNVFQEKGSNGDVPSAGNCYPCAGDTSVKIGNDSGLNSTNTLDEPGTLSQDDVKTHSDQNLRSGKGQGQLPAKQADQNGGNEVPSFKRSSSLRGNKARTGNGVNEKAFRTPGFDSFRLPRDPTAELQPITDPVLLQKLIATTGIQASHLKLSPKDQKLLSLMLAKKEQERQVKLRRESSYLQRIEEKGNLTASSSSSFFRRQLSLREGRVKYDQVDSKHSLQSSRCLQENHCQEVSERQHPGQHSERHCCHPDNEHECCSRYPKSVVLPPGKEHIACSRQHSRELCCHGDNEEHKCCSRYSTSLTSPPDKVQQSKKQLQQALERKKQVEQHLKGQKQKTEKYLAQLKEKQEQEQQRALATRQEKAKRLSERSRRHNLQADQKLKEVKENKKMTMEELMAVHEEKQAHLTAAELKVKQLRESEKAKIESEIRRKLERSQQKQQQLEEELKKWQTELLEFRQLQETNAQSLAQAALVRKREALAKEREAKERLQKENLTRMMAKEREWRAELEASIQSKDARSRMIQEEKEKMIKRSREAALTSRRIRQELRLNLSMTDLDLLVTRPE